MARKKDHLVGHDSKTKFIKVKIKGISPLIMTAYVKYEYPEPKRCEKCGQRLPKEVCY